MRDNWITTNLFQMADSAPKSFVDGDWIESPYITNEGIRLIQTGNIGIGQFKGKSKKYISEKSFKQLNCTEVFPGDLLICRLAEPAGRACIVPNLDERFITSVDVSIFRPNNSYSKEFIHQLLNTDSFLNKVEILSGGSTRQRISRTNLGSINLNLPPLPQQRKIAKILSTCDTVIAKTEEAIAKYQAIKQGMMHDLFTRGIDLSTGKLRPKYQDAPELYKESELGLIPKDWEVEELGINNESYAGGTPNRSIKSYYKGLIPWVSSGEVNKPFIFSTNENISKEALRFSSAKMAPKESVLVAMYGATAAQVSMLKIEACTNQAVLSIISGLEWNNYFLYYALNFSKERILFLAQGSGQPNLNKALIDTTKVWKPKISEQEATVERLNSIQSKIDAEQESLSKHQKIKSGLMQDLLSGKVEVSVSKETMINS